MKKIGLLLAGVVMTITLFSQSDQKAWIDQIEGLMEAELRKENISNVFLSIHSPTRDFEWHSAKGAFRDGSQVTIENPYYTASVGKTFTATGIGVLVDQGKIRIEDPVTQYLTDELMGGLHVLEGIDYSDSIKISHLLQHTSGLPDYFEEETIDGAPAIFDLIMSEPDRFWDPVELIQFSKAHFAPSFAPGTDYRYTDTEYVLLGLIIENLSGMPFHEFLKRHIFAPLEMRNTYLNQRSEANQTASAMAEMYAGEYEISSLRSLSADWAGGAVVSTGRDLITFHKALMNGKLVSQVTLKAMQQWIPETQGMAYGYGLRKVSFAELSPTLPPWKVIGHSGLNGTSLYYCPDLDIYLASTLNQLEASRDALLFMVNVLMLCAEQ